MSAARVINISSGERYDVYIGRAVARRGLARSPWANPFKIGPDGDRDEVIEKYRQWVTSSDDPPARWIREHVGELRGKTLACWCAPLACHGHVLAELAGSLTLEMNKP